ncbi:MAG: hypothetical protein WBG00_09790, partial [Thermoanaerobaculia bacterium]
METAIQDRSRGFGGFDSAIAIPGPTARSATAKQSTGLMRKPTRALASTHAGYPEESLTVTRKITRPDEKIYT